MAVTTDHPVLLLPMRLETRVSASSELLIRIYPDAISVSAHQPQLLESEASSGIDYQNALVAAEGLASEAEKDEARRGAWRRLAACHGPARAAWIARQTAGAADVSQVETRPDHSFVASKVLACPRQYAAFVYSRDGELLNGPVLGNEVPADTLRMVGDPSRAQLFDEDTQWVVDFDAAVGVGMAIRVPLAGTAPEEIGRVVVVGLRDETPQQGSGVLAALIDSHHYTSGFAFVTPGTPTNNTSTVQSGHTRSQEDRERSYGDEVQPRADALSSDSNAARLSSALGFALQPDGSDVLSRVANASSCEQQFVAPLHRALWPATGDFLLRHLLRKYTTPSFFLESVPDGTVVPEIHLSGIAEHFAKYVRGGGPLPTVRVGHQPYGILPVACVRRDSPGSSRAGWKASTRDSNPPTPQARDLDDGIHRVVSTLFESWLEWSKDPRRVPRVGETEDPDLELLQILSMSSASQSYKVRPFLCERFGGWLLAILRYRVFAGLPFTAYRSPGFWVGAWGGSWDRTRDRAARLWNEISTGTASVWPSPPDPLHLSDTPAFHMLGWWQSLPMSLPLVGENTKSDLEALLSQPATPPAETLLVELLCRSLKLTAARPPVLTEVRAAIQTIIDNVGLPESNIDRALREALDLHTCRLDAWVTAHASKRLSAMRATATGKEGIYLGAYGWLDGVAKAPGAHGGFVHAPSRGQAAAAAVLQSAYLTHQSASGSAPNPFALDLSSDRVRRGLELLDAVRAGQPTGALLGEQLERALHETGLDRLVDDLRSAFPLVTNKETQPAPGEPTEAMGARNVVDGLQLVRWWQDPGGFTGTVQEAALQRVASFRAATGEPWDTLRQFVAQLVESLDCTSDLLTFESVYQTVQGNYDRAGAALEAASGNGAPPDVEAMKFPLPSTTIQQRACLLVPERARPTLPGLPVRPPKDPRGQAEPRIAAWLEGVVGDLKEIGCSCTFESRRPGAVLPFVTHTLGVDKLGLSASDLVYLATKSAGGASEIERRIGYLVRREHGLRHDMPVAIDFARPRGFSKGLGEVLELCRSLRELIATGTILRPAVLVPPGAPEVSFSPSDIDAFSNRCRAVGAAIGRVRDRLSASIDEAAETVPKPEVAAERLFEACRYESSWQIPASPNDPMFFAYARNARNELTKRLEAFDAFAGAPPDPALSPDKAMDDWVSAMRALFNGSLVVLPTFQAPDPNGLRSTLQDPALLAGLGEGRLRLWLRQAAHVSGGLRVLEDARMMTDAVASPNLPAALPLVVAQLPHDPNQRWVGLDDAERGSPINGPGSDRRGFLSIVAAIAGVPKQLFDSRGRTRPLAGLLIDQWDEVVPSGKAATSVAFQYNAPNAQAPQALLLAVPAHNDGATANWSYEELAAIVGDTLDLAKVRAVDLDAIGRRAGTSERDAVGVMLPGLTLPVRPDQWEWRRPGIQTLGGWFSVLPN